MGSLALLRGISNIVARLSMGQGWGGRPTAITRWPFGNPGTSSNINAGLPIFR